MALVTKFSLHTKERASLHEEVDCHAFILEPSGTRVLQLDTMGSHSRAMPSKVSQSIQFDAAAAVQLMRLLVRAFPELETVRR